MPVRPRSCPQRARRPRRNLAALLTGAALAGVTARAQAGAVTVSVSDAAGHPLGEAVVFLQPATGKLAAKPLEKVEIAQQKRQFSPRVTIVTVGTPVTFPNFDTVRHHVFSFSPIKTFELKLYAGVPAQPVVFDKPGFAVLGCNIHDQMAAWVAVLDTPLYAKSAETGRARVDNVPAGAYRLRVWHPGLAANDEPAAVALTVGEGGADQAIKLNVGSNPLAPQ